MPISYQSLGRELGSVGSSGEHVIEVRATDEAGLTAMQSFPFGMDLLSPPVRFSRLPVVTGAGIFPIGSQNLGALYGSLPETEAMTGEIALSASPPARKRRTADRCAAHVHSAECRDARDRALGGHAFRDRESSGQQPADGLRVRRTTRW